MDLYKINSFPYKNKFVRRQQIRLMCKLFRFFGTGGRISCDGHRIAHTLLSTVCCEKHSKIPNNGK